MEETLTISRLRVTGSLARTVTRNVKRWRNGRMVLRWAAAGLEVAERRSRPVNGCRDIPQLVEALRAHVGGACQR